MQDIEPLPSKRPNLSPKPSSSNPGGTFARTTSSGSYREASAVSPELQSQLESIGMRTRFNVNRGYARPFFPLQQVEVQSQSQAQRFQTEREVFQGVLGTKEKWGRTKSAPMRNFASFPDSAGETMDGELDLKRAREDVFAEFMEEDDDDDQDMTESSSSHGSKPIKSLPQRAPGSGTAFNTTMTLPASSDLASYLAHGQAQGRPEEATQDENWRAVDFSSFAKQHDF